LGFVSAPVFGGALAAGIVGAVAVGCVAGALARRVPERMRFELGLALVLAGPVAAFAAYEVINPDPDCTEECWGRAVWAAVLLIETVAWWIGLGVGRLVGRRRGRKAS
jgi:hypothetical protein